MKLNLRSVMINALVLLSFLLFFKEGYAQKTYNIALKDETSTAIDLVNKPIKITVAHAGNVTTFALRSDGVYAFSAEDGDVFTVTNTITGEELLSIKLDATKSPYTALINTKASGATVAPASKAVGSSKNYWIGASVAYNLDGGSTEDIVGGSKIRINMSEVFPETSRSSFGVIGNIGTFFSNTDKAENQKAISKLAQSQTGLAVGLGYIFELSNPEKRENKAPKTRVEVTTGYRLNSFKDPKIDTSSIGLSQFRSAFLFEAELAHFKKGGRMTLSSEISYSIFKSATYERIFGEKKSNRVALETSFILPITENIGFLTNVIATQGISPVYQFGIIIKSDQ